MLRDPFVTAEELVAAVADEHHFHVAAYFPREIPGRKAGGVGEWLIQPLNDPLEVLGDRGRDNDLGVTQPERARCLARGSRLVEVRAGEGSSERLVRGELLLGKPA